jgi:hypothetical protein
MIDNCMDEAISIPFLGKVKIDFDSAKKAFFLSVPIYHSYTDLPSSVKKYVEVREGHFFNPYKTSFKLNGLSQVDLVQELPFQWGFQPSFREQVHAFRKLAAQSHQILLEIAIDEKLAQIEEHLMDSLLK